MIRIKDSANQFWIKYDKTTEKPLYLSQTMEELKTESEHAAGQYSFPLHLFRKVSTSMKTVVLGGLKMAERFSTKANRDMLLCANYWALNNIDRDRKTDISAFAC